MANPTKYTLERVAMSDKERAHWKGTPAATSTHKLVLKVWKAECLNGFSVIESIPVITGKSLEGLRKHGAKLAKHWKIPFIDSTI